MHNLIKITSRWKRDLPYPQNNQLQEHNKASTFCGNRQLWYLSRIRPPMLNADSEATVVIGILIMSRAICESSRKWPPFDSQYWRKSKSIWVLWSNQVSSKYTSNYDLLSIEPEIWLSNVSKPTISASLTFSFAPLLDAFSAILCAS